MLVGIYRRHAPGVCLCLARRDYLTFDFLLYTHVRPVLYAQKGLRPRVTAQAPCDHSRRQTPVVPLPMAARELYVGYWSALSTSQRARCSSDMLWLSITASAKSSCLFAALDAPG